MYNIPLDLQRFKPFLKAKAILEKGPTQTIEKRYILDPIREKWLVYQPEELIRQLIVQYFIEEKQFNKNRIQIERQLKVNKRLKRTDILVFNQEMQPWLLVECKAPNIKINEAVMKQISIYNLELRVPYLMVSNGIDTYCCKMDYEARSYDFIEQIPDFES